MKEDKKNIVKKGVMAGAGTAAGAAVGAVINNAVDQLSSKAAPTDEPIMAEVAEEAMAATEEEVNVEYAAAPVELDEVVVVAQAHSPANHQPNSHTAVSQGASHQMEDSHEEPIMASVVAAAPTKEEDPFDDFEVVSEGSDVHEDLLAVQIDVAAPAPDFAMASKPGATPIAESMDAPSYISEDDFTMKADGDENSSTAADVLDMPDYMNNANIDSFIDSI